MGSRTIDGCPPPSDVGGPQKGNAQRAPVGRSKRDSWTGLRVGRSTLIGPVGRATASGRFGIARSANDGAVAEGRFGGMAVRDLG